MLFRSVLLSLAASVAAAATSTPTPTPPGLEYLYSLNCTLGDKFSVGTGPYGEVRVIPIVGGWFEGPKMKGEVLDLGADWNYRDSRNKTHPDTRYQLRTDDGADIYLKTSGTAQDDGVTHLRGVYETGSDKYWWLNDAVAVGILSSDPSGEGAWVFIDMWTITSPKSKVE